uniref:Metalloendopeptidase OMA1, mitochondrial n=1 Tax=Timema cristinae TaxID=61476 RepID=A0A7R9CE72_TIMCR|nr:unnamed protein product [Timema cristinae]
MEHSASNAELREPSRDGNSLLRMCSQPWASAELVSHYALLVSCSPGLVKVRPEVLSRCSPQAQSTGECSHSIGRDQIMQLADIELEAQDLLRSKAVALTFIACHNHIDVPESSGMCQIPYLIFHNLQRSNLRCQYPAAAAHQIQMQRHRLQQLPHLLQRGPCIIFTNGYFNFSCDTAEIVWVSLVPENSALAFFDKNDGKMFIFTGMIAECSNDDQLAIIMTHEMAHALLSHMGCEVSDYLQTLLEAGETGPTEENIREWLNGENGGPGYQIQTGEKIAPDVLSPTTTNQNTDEEELQPLSKSKLSSAREALYILIGVIDLTSDPELQPFYRHFRTACEIIGCMVIYIGYSISERDSVGKTGHKQRTFVAEAVASVEEQNPSPPLVKLNQLQHLIQSSRVSAIYSSLPVLNYLQNYAHSNIPTFAVILARRNSTPHINTAVATHLAHGKQDGERLVSSVVECRSGREKDREATLPQSAHGENCFPRFLAGLKLLEESKTLTCKSPLTWRECEKIYLRGADIQRATRNGNATKTAVARVEHIELNVTVYTAGNERKTAMQLLGNSCTTSFPGTTCCKPVYQECKEKWKNIHTVFRRHLSSKPPSGSGAQTKKDYYLSDVLQFLVPIILEGKQQVGNLPSPPRDADNLGEEQVKDLPRATLESNPQPTVDQLRRNRKQLKRKTESDQLDSCMSQYFQSKLLKNSSSKSLSSQSDDMGEPRSVFAFVSAVDECPTKLQPPLLTMTSRKLTLCDTHLESELAANETYKPITELLNKMVEMFTAISNHMDERKKDLPPVNNYSKHLLVTYLYTPHYRSGVPCPSENNIEWFSVLLTHSAAYMLKASANLKIFYTKLIHVTCLARAVHRVAEDIRSHFTNVNAIISTVKKVFLKAPSQIFSFKAALPNTPLLQKPLVQTFDEEQAVAITEANAAISCSSVSADPAYVKSNLGNLLGTITVLEERDLLLLKAVKIMRGIEENLNQASGSFGTAIVDKFNRVLQRNPGWKAEQLSNVQLIEMFLLLALIVIWAVLPDGAAILSQFISHKFVTFAIHLPFSRKLELEADIVGLDLAARACFDVREAIVFWEKMRQLTISGDEENVAEWLSTHPSHENRVEVFKKLMPSALNVRDIFKCPRLSGPDPRREVICIDEDIMCMLTDLSQFRRMCTD